MFEQLRRNPYLKKHLGWKMPICQHMMYCLIDEDRGEPVIRERFLPWGAPDAATYIKRIERNLDSLGEVEGLLLNYQIAAVDMESLNRDFPEVARKMQYWHKQGKLDFVGGSFSQGHMQAISAESNWRQFEMGVRFFSDFFGKQIKLYARQETGLHQQIPQLLKKFGYEMIVMPQFPWAIEIISGRFEITSAHTGTSIMKGDEFVMGQALDGTKMPVFLTGPVAAFGDVDPTHEEGLIPAIHGHNPYNVKMGISKDMYGPPPVIPYFPDLMEVGQKFYDEIDEFCTVTFLEDALFERLKQAPPRATARIISYWSCYEGGWAGEVLRKNKEAEGWALLTEAMGAMALSAKKPFQYADDISKIWHTIIKYQHHDVLWNEATDLQRKAINYMDEGIEKCKDILNGLGDELIEKEADSIAIFNSLANERTALIEVEKDKIPAGDSRFQKFDDKCIGFRKLPAGGYKSFEIDNSMYCESKAVEMPNRITTKYYTVEFSDNGLLKQITTPDGRSLLDTGKYIGGEVRAMIDQQWKDNRVAECSFFEGDVCYILERKTTIGQIPLIERYLFFREKRQIKVELNFEFDGDTVGYYWLDETKLNVYYPTTGSDIHYDIPFGYDEGRELRPLFAINWLHCGGLTYVNRGTVKHWVRDGVIANVIAWGSMTFDNRIHFDFWTKEDKYDIRLYGKHKIEYSLIPHGVFNGDQTVHDVNDIIAPVWIVHGKGEKSFYGVKDKDLALTAIYVKDNQIWARGYKMHSENKSKFRDFEIFNLLFSEL